MRVALYPRVSGHEQEDNYSIPEQIERMKKYCEAKDWMVYKIYTDSSGRDLRGMAEIIIAKHRNGAVGDVLLSFKGQFTRFQDREADNYIPIPGEEINSTMNTSFSSPSNISADPLDFPIPPIGEVPY